MKLPLGYRYAAGYAGIRKEQRDDVGLIVSEPIAQAAAVFTQNVIAAAPVRLARKHLKSSKGKVAAVLVNAGNANCATKSGDRVALASCRALARAMQTKIEYVLPASTGVIGVELDSKLLTSAVPKLVAKLSHDAFDDVANAILTTDTRSKWVTEEVQLPGGVVRTAGMTKGAGMIHPKMATTLGFVITDALLGAQTLRRILLSAIKSSFNSLTVDGDMSTNDMVLLLANGASKVRLREGDLNVLRQGITTIMEYLARQIAADGEGARKLIVVQVAGFRTAEEAHKVARAVANSPLVKTAIAGGDPNWGRILAAAGYAGVNFNSQNIDIHLQNVPVCHAGVAAQFDEAALRRKLEQREVQIQIALGGRGKAQARFFTCDLTEGYIQINGSYRT